MANVFPFRAVRPTRDKVSLVTSRSYGDYSPAELAAQLTYNPLSFLHILNPAYNDPQKSSASERFAKVSEKYREFKAENILVQDENPSFYIHRIATPNHIFTGIIAATSVEDYKSDVIKRHEDTIAYRVEWLKDYIRYAGFNTEPVLMTYRDDRGVEQWLTSKTSAPADFEFSTTKNDVHFLWRIDAEHDVKMLQDLMSEAGPLYIADGHHRSASAELLYDEASASNPNSHYFMSFLIADSNVKIYEFNRLVRNLNGLTTRKFLDRLADEFIISAKGPAMYHPHELHEFSIYLDGQFHSLLLKKELRKFVNPVQGLDTQILYDRILHPILGIKDLRSDSRIDYVPGNKPMSRLKNCVDDGSYALAFILYPVGIEQIKAVADARMTMPPKSTYIEPKFRSGLVVYEI